MKKLFAILIMCSLSLPVFANTEQEVEMIQDSSGKLEVITEDLDDINNSVTETDMTLTQEKLPSKFKEPMGKKKLVKKFIVAMLCVIGTSVFIYAALSLYNKIRENVLSGELNDPDREQPLDVPCDLSEAVKSFIEKTHWEE